MNRILLMLGLVLALCGQTFAASFPFTAANIEATAPDGWKTSSEGDTATFTAPDGTLSVVFTLLPKGAEDKAAEIIEKELDKSIGKVAWAEKPTKEKINDLDWETWEGTAKEGKMVVEANYITGASDRELALFWFSTPEADKKYKAEIDSITKSVKKIK